MRIVLSVLACAALTAAARAESPRRVGVVNPPGTTARAGPSDSFPDTGGVPAGTRVVVVKPEGDYYAVEPPAGQRSWVPAQVLVDPDARPGQPGARDPAGGRWNAVVAPDGPADIPVLAGDADRPRPLPVHRLSVPTGTILTVTGPAVEHNRAKWYPVEPPEGDWRYLPKSAVELTSAATPAFSVASPANAGVLLAEPASPTPPPALAVSRDPPRASEATQGGPRGEPLWAEAESAAAAGDLRRAERLYLQLAARLNHAERRDDAAACFARLHQVRTLAAPGERSTAGAWHGPGLLQPTQLVIDGRESYAVRDPAGRTLCYVVAGSGVDLARFRGYRVELYGSEEARGDLNGAPLVRASRVQQAR